MSVTGWKTAGTVANVLYDPTALGTGPTWTNPTNAQGAADGSSATMTFGSNPVFGQRQCLIASNFSLASSVPVGATIDGIEFRVTRKNTQTGTATLVDQFFYAVPASGSLGQGSNAADTINQWSTASFEQKTYGGASSLFGQSITYADVIDSDFGCHFVPSGSVPGPGNSAIATVDSVEIRVYYTGGTFPARRRRPDAVRVM